MTTYLYLPFTLTLDAPVIVTTFGGDPNSSRTLPYLPGSLFRGVAARNLGDPEKDPQKWDEFRDFVLGGKVRWLNAYPVYNDLRSLPVPESLRREKKSYDEKEVNLVDLAAHLEDWPEDPLERVPHSFLTFEADSSLVQPKIGAQLHHQRDRIKGRAWKDSSGQNHGTIFVYEYLEAGQQFGGLVQLCGESEDECLKLAEKIKNLLGEKIFIGRSKRARYGGVAKVTWKDPQEQEREIEYSGRSGLRPLWSNISKGQRFRLFLIADAIVRHPETGQIDPQAFPLLIERIFKDRVQIIFKAFGYTVRGGFNRKWRLEIPQVFAVKAGSLLLLEAKEDISEAEIQTLIHEGIGERKEEGFGRFILLDKPLKTLFVRLPQDSEEVEQPESGPPELVRFMEKRILLKYAKATAMEKGLEMARDAEKIPSNSILGRLRTPLRKGPSEGLEVLRCWLTSENDEERLKKEAMDKLEKCKLSSNNRNLKEWIKEILKLESVSDFLNLENLAGRYHLTSKENAFEVLLAERERLTSWLIDALLSGLRLRNKLEEENRD
jgi:CRISPR-associated protein Csx10